MSNILLFVFRGQKPAHMPLFTLNCVQCIVTDKCYTKPAIYDWSNKFTNSQESVINKERSGRSVVLMAARSFFIDNIFLTMSKLLESKCALLIL